MIQALRLWAIATSLVDLVRSVGIYLEVDLEPSWTIHYLTKHCEEDIERKISCDVDRRYTIRSIIVYKISCMMNRIDLRSYNEAEDSNFIS